MENVIGTRQMKLIDDLVNHFVVNEELFQGALIGLQGYISISKKLKPLIHTIKSRIKDPLHLKDKLIRKAIEAKENNVQFDITKDNLFLKINDLAGFRIIHLHTKQIENIDKILKEILKEQQWDITEGPEAKTWDIESAEYFKSLGFDTVDNVNMYTSIHYIIKPSPSITCEIQVRTLMEEVWGEVDHSINYPHKTHSIPCREQIKVLARATSSCSRLVDSIFSSHLDYQKVEAEKLKISSLTTVPKKRITKTLSNKKSSKGTSVQSLRKTK